MRAAPARINSMRPEVGGASIARLGLPSHGKIPKRFSRISSLRRFGQYFHRAKSPLHSDFPVPTEAIK